MLASRNEVPRSLGSLFGPNSPIVGYDSGVPDHGLWATPLVDFKRISWVEDAAMLALDLYIREGALDDTHPDVVELSVLLRSLPIHPMEIRSQAKFRNPNGVSLKLKNFLPMDPGYDRVGMTRNRA